MLLTLIRHEESLKSLVAIAEAVLKEVHNISARLPLTISNLPDHSIDSSQYKSLEISRENPAELFSSQKLRELCVSYMENVHVLHPIFDRPREMCEAFIEEYGDTATARKDWIIPSLHDAKVLLFLALGSCKQFSGGPMPSGIIPGMAYYSCAQVIIAKKREEHSTCLAQAMTLAALYNNQIGKLGESWVDIICAYRIYTNHGN